MTQKLPVVLSDDKRQHQPLAEGDTLNTSAIPISKDSGNMIQVRDDGIYYGVVAPADIRVHYISSTLGDDRNDGSKKSPIRTINEAAKRIAARNVGGSYALRLRAGETFPLSSIAWLGEGKINLSLEYYDDAIFGELRSRQGWWPQADTRLNRPTVVFDTYLEGGIVNPSAISCGDAGSLIFNGVSAVFANSAGKTTGGGWFLYWSTMDFIGSDIELLGDYVGIGSSTNILLRQCNLKHTGATQAFIADYAPQLFQQELIIPGGTVRDPLGEGPDVIGRGHNLSKNLKVSKAMALATYNSSTKTFFGWGANWDIFANA